MRLRKKIALIIIACSFFSGSVSAEMNSIITNTATNAPLNEPAVITGSNMDLAPGSGNQEGVPSAFYGVGQGGRLNYYDLGDERGFCTKMTSITGSPYMHYVTEYRTTGKMIFDLDFARSSTLGGTVFHYTGRTTSGTPVWNEMAKIDATGTLIVSEVTNQENYEKYKNVKAGTDNFLRFHMILDLDNQLKSIYINGDEISKDIPIVYKHSIGFYMFRVTHGHSGSEESYCFIDNMWIRYDTGFNYTLLHDSTIIKNNTSDTMVRGVPILVDRYNTAVYPMVQNGTTIVPLRFFADTIRANILYNGENGDIVINNKGKIAKLNLNSTTMTKDGQTYIMSSPPKLISGRTFLTLDAMLRALDLNAYYDENGHYLITEYANVLESDYGPLIEFMEEETNK